MSGAPLIRYPELWSFSIAVMVYCIIFLSRSPSTIAAACQQYKKRHVMSLHGNVPLQVLLLASIVSGTHWMASYRLPRSLAQRDADGQTLRLQKDLHRKQHYPTYNHSFSSVTTRVRAFSYYLLLSAALYNLSLSSSSSQPVPVTGHCFLSVLSPAHDWN